MPVLQNPQLKLRFRTSSEPAEKTELNDGHPITADLPTATDRRACFYLNLPNTSLT